MHWLKIDPRSYFNKRGKIIIVKPNIRGNGLLDIGIGEVETHQGYSIQTSFDGDHKWVDEDDKWDQDWRWIVFPDVDEKLKGK